jgi:uncharacterized protein DUF4238
MSGSVARSPVSKQHVVSQTVLRNFTTSRPNNATTLGKVTLKTGRYEEASPSNSGYVRDWTTEYSGEAEQLWQGVEAHTPAVVNATLQRSVFQDVRLTITLKALAALHYLRSINTRRSGQWAADAAMDLTFDRIISKPATRAYLTNEFVQARGSSPKTDDELRGFFAEFVAANGKATAPQNFRKKVETTYIEMLRHFAKCSVEVLVTKPRDRMFIIGDSPVVPVAPAPIGTPAVHYVPALLDSDELYFPIHPTLCLKFPAEVSGFRDAGGREVDMLNQLQIERAYRHVHFLPDQKTQDFVQKRARGWKEWPEVTGLTFR